MLNCISSWRETPASTSSTLTFPTAAYESDTRIFPEITEHREECEESLDVWGFVDTHFQASADGAVEVTGNRYPLSGQKLPNLLPWISNLMEVDVSAKVIYPSIYPTPIPESVINEDFLAELQLRFGAPQVSQDPAQRLRHGHGHSQSEMYAIKHAQLRRVPDIVLYPKNEEDVIHLVKAAGKHNVSIIPYGGGTNVSEALECPHGELRMIVSVDMRQMNRVLWYDPVNRMAAIESGAVGRHIVKELAKYGYTIGHEPDSIEFSTLGGWIATNASGMKKNKYGNIEDIVLDINVITSIGRLERTAALPRESVGIDMRRLLFGSEGSLGIITSAVIKIFPIPEVQQYGSILFPSFEKGVAFMYELTQRGGQPASIRLVDNMQFQFSMALKPASTGVKAVMGRLQKEYVTRIKGFDSQKMVACTLVLEGRADEVKHQESIIYALAAKHKGLKAGSENGERGYLLTYNIAYIRDFGIDHYIIAESFETSVPWSRTLELCQRTKDRVFKEHAKRKLPGKPFVTCRVTQVYESGVAVYFYLAFFFQNVEDPSGTYAEIEKAARDEILLCGGALSHHHGVGKLRKGFLDRIMSQEALEWRKKLKNSVDPGNIFGAGNFAN